MIEGKDKVCHEIYASQESICQFTSTTLEIPLATTKISNPGRGSAGIPTIGRESISEDRSIHRRVEGGSEELNILAKPE